MRVPLLLLVITVFGSAACQRKREEPPPLSRDQMVGLMMEIYLAEARTSLLPVAKDSSYRLFLAYQDTLMHRRGVQDSTLRKAYAYYLQHPAELEAIYDAIIDSLSLREQLLREAPQGPRP
ncbi:MAG: DUF4296 domain-containing protein [Cyclobacteriaceae bacterium]|nr:DUF4296 domain-containing protein [Cyclobacteriaceae bacterium]